MKLDYKCLELDPLSWNRVWVPLSVDHPWQRPLQRRLVIWLWLWILPPGPPLYFCHSQCRERRSEVWSTFLLHEGAFWTTFLRPPAVCQSPEPQALQCWQSGLHKARKLCIFSPCIFVHKMKMKMKMKWRAFVLIYTHRSCIDYVKLYNMIIFNSTSPLNEEMRPMWRRNN